MNSHDFLRAAVQIARPCVVAKPGPVRQHTLHGRRRQAGNIGKAGQKTLVIRDHRRHLGLLQHDFRQPDAVRIARVLPGQVMSAGLALPGNDGRCKRGFLGQF